MKPLLFRKSKQRMLEAPILYTEGELQAVAGGLSACRGRLTNTGIDETSVAGQIVDVRPICDDIDQA